MKNRIMGEEIEHAKSKRILDQDNKYHYQLVNDEFMKQIFDQILAPQYQFQVKQDGFYMQNGGQIRHEPCGNHVEINTPECLSLRDLVASDKAIERVALKLCSDVKKNLNTEMVLHKKNADFNSEIILIESGVVLAPGYTRGCHENYCVEPAFIKEVSSLNEKRCKNGFGAGDVDNRLWHFLLFMETRQILSGSGGLKLLKNKNGQYEAVYLISPRALHTNLNFGRSTNMSESRGIIDQTRASEPLADPDKFGRLHIICGDANMSEVSTFLKFGTTSAVLEMIENDFWDKNLIAEDPDWEAQMFRNISRDLTCQNVPIHLLNRKIYNAIGIQKLFQKRWHEYVKAAGFPEEKTLLGELWKEALECLERGDEKINQMLDWKIKQRVLKNYADKKSLALNHDRLLTIDLEYHNPDPEKGIYNKLKNRNLVSRFVSDADIEKAVGTPPENTRASLRRYLIDIFASLGIKYTMKWEAISFQSSRLPEFNFMPYTVIALPDPFAYNLDVFDDQVNKATINRLEHIKKKSEKTKAQEKRGHGRAETNS